MRIPFFRPSIGEEEITAVTDCLRSGWLTTGPRTKQFEADFAAAVGARHAVALNSGTAALHLALEAIGLQRGEGVLVPTMTFAATAEVVQYFGARVILVDCRDEDLNLDVAKARVAARSALAQGVRLRAILPMHYGGLAADMAGVAGLAREFGLHVIEDAAHCGPARHFESSPTPWRAGGAGSDICCYSFYANKCITTGEGGMACTDNAAWADRMRLMSLHGLSRDAWKRFSDQGTWAYDIVAPGFKYNMTDLAAALGGHQLRKAAAFRAGRARVAEGYSRRLAGVSALRLPANAGAAASWHLYAVRLQLGQIALDRAAVIEALKAAGIGTSVHWIPLHLHPYYRNHGGYRAADYPVATQAAAELISLPIYPDMSEDEVGFVADTLAKLLRDHRR